MPIMWERDVARARERALTERKPVFIYVFKEP